MRYHTPALEYIAIINQSEKLAALLKKYKDGALARVDYAFALMCLPVDALSVLNFRAIYREMRYDGERGEKERQALRTTANAYLKLQSDKCDLNYWQFTECSPAKMAIDWLDTLLHMKRFEPKYFKSFWFGMDFRFLPSNEESSIRPMRWDLHCTPSFNPEGVIQKIVRSINNMFRRAYALVTPEFLLMPEHIRGLLINRNKK